MQSPPRAPLPGLLSTLDAGAPGATYLCGAEWTWRGVLVRLLRVFRSVQSLWGKSDAHAVTVPAISTEDLQP